MSIDDRDSGIAERYDRWGARCRARFGRPDLDPDLLAAGLPDRLRSAAARRSPPAGPRTRRGPASQPQHDPGGLSSFVGCGLRHQSPRRGHPCRRAPAAAPRRRGTRRDRGRDAAPGRPGRLHRRRGGRRDLRRRHGAQAPRPARPRPVRRVHERRRGLRRRAPGRRVPRDRSRPRAPCSTTSPTGSIGSTTTSSPRRPSTRDEAQALVAGRVPVVAMLVGPGYVELVHEIAGLPSGSRVGLICASERGTDNIRETLTLSGTSGVEIVSALDRRARRPRAGRPDRGPHPDVARGAGGRPRRPLSRTERIRPWTYDFDPSGLELLRRAIEHVAAARPVEAQAV